MKKVMNINIGGMVFSIEEEAFQRLKKYLSEIKDHFQSNPTHEGILQDIESSIAEKFSDKKRNIHRAVTQKDIKDIISDLGTVQEMSDEEEENTLEAMHHAREERNVRRLYRNSDDAILGGVASGISNYFNIDPIIIRVLFIFLIFITEGVGIVIYLILWVIIPKAKTTSQKLAMKGEHPSLETIKNYMEEKMKDIPAKNIFQKILTLPIIIIELFVRFIKTIFPILRVVIGILILGITSILIFALFTIFLTLILGSTNIVTDPFTGEVLNIFLEQQNTSFFFFSIFISFFIPLFLLFTGGIYLIFKKKIINVGVFTFVIFCLIFSLGYSISSTITHVGDIEKAIQSIESRIENGEKIDLYFKINEKTILTSNDEEIFHEEPDIFFPPDKKSLIGGDAVAPKVIPGQKEFSLIGSLKVLSPSEITVKKNDEVTLRFRSEEGVLGLIIDEFSVRSDISHGETIEIIFIADKKGEFEILTLDENGETNIMGQIVVK